MKHKMLNVAKYFKELPSPAVTTRKHTVCKVLK